jgi:UDP-glucose:(heptosyl)LPS alpha-1,3-glucosyltransferase
VRRGHSATGGAEAFLKRFAYALVKREHECVLFASAEWPRDEWPHGRIFTITGKSPRAFADALAAMEPKKYCDVVFSFERVWSCDCYRAGDGVHRAWIERRAKYEQAWRVWLRRFNRKHREILQIEKKLFSPEGARCVIANSNFARDEIVRDFGYPAEKIHPIHNGLAFEKFHIEPELRARIRREMGIGENEYVVLFVGRGWERKGLRFAIKAVNRATKSKPLLLVAGHDKRAGLPQSDRVKFLGAMRDIVRVLAAADVFILPTIYDPFSNACLEALAAGLPVITTRANGFSEIIAPGEEGEVVTEPHDVAALAAAVEKWGDKSLRERIRPRLLSIAEKFSIEANLDATLNVIQSLG